MQIGCGHAGRKQIFPFPVQSDFGRNDPPRRIRLLHVGRAAPGKLHFLEYFVAAYLEITPSGFVDPGRVRYFKHIAAVAFVLHAQADAETRVAPYFIVNDARRFLGRQDQMHAQRTADGRDADQLVHEFRLILFELRELVDNDHQMRERPAALAFQKLVIFVDVLQVSGIVQYFLPSDQLRFERNLRPFHEPAAQIGDRSDDMGQVDERVGHAPAFVVDQHESKVMRVELGGKRSDDRLDDLAFARSGRAGDQAVRAVPLPFYFIMNVQIDLFAARAYAKRDGQAFRIPVVSPVLLHVQVGRFFDIQHFE